MNTKTVSLHARDVSGQREADLPNVPGDYSVGELVQNLLAEIKLPENDGEGQTISYQAYLDREGRPLQSSELVGDALQDQDRIVLQPNIDAGG